VNPAIRARRLRIAAIIAAVTAVFLVAAGARQLTFVETGPRTTAIVRTCTWDRTGRSSWTECTGTWTDPNAGGRIVRGTIAGAQPGDENTPLDVRIHGDTAYTDDLFSPAVLFVMGLFTGAFGAIFVRMANRLRAP
jgi:hypothetical protein